MFDLHPQLKHDCIVVGEYELSLLLLMNDSNFPWFILVPRRPNMREIFQLKKGDREQLNRESIHLAETLNRVFDADKMNIAALGNVVPQLHIHHIVRYEHDLLWPAPIWGKLAAKPYAKNEIKVIITKLERQVEKGFVFLKN